MPGSGAGLVGVRGWSKAGVCAQSRLCQGSVWGWGETSTCNWDQKAARGCSQGRLHLGSGLSQCRGWSPIFTACVHPQQLICSTAAELCFLFGSDPPWPAPSH